MTCSLRPAAPGSAPWPAFTVPQALRCRGGQSCRRSRHSWPVGCLHGDLVCGEPVMRALEAPGSLPGLTLAKPKAAFVFADTLLLGSALPTGPPRSLHLGAPWGLKG